MIRNPVLKQIVTPSEVESLLAMRDALDSLKKRLSLMEQAIDSTETAIIAKIDAGANTTGCGFIVEIREATRRFPSWKEHFIDLAGKDAADRVLRETPPKLYRNLIIKAAA